MTAVGLASSARNIKIGVQMALPLDPIKGSVIRSGNFAVAGLGPWSCNGAYARTHKQVLCINSSRSGCPRNTTYKDVAPFSLGLIKRWFMYRQVPLP